MNRTSVVAIALAAALSTAGAAHCAPLDISDGFNMDVWCGPLEQQDTYSDGSHNLFQLQGDLPDGVGWYVLQQSRLLAVNSTSSGFGQPYSISGQWFHPLYLGGTDGTPEDGVLTGGDGREYHVASVLGNDTLEGDWTEPADPSSAWDTLLNAVVVGSKHNTADWQVDEVEIELPAGQKGRYSDVNFVLAAMNMSDRARNMRIVALYGSTGADEEVLYSFSTAEGGSGPTMPDQDGGTDFAIVCSFTKCHNYSVGATGAVADYSGSLYEFDEPLEVDSTKDLWGFRVEDVNPSLNWNSRGIVVLAASATPAIVPLDIADGFNMDVWCGPLEQQDVYTDGSHNLQQLQGDLPDGVGWYVCEQSKLLACNSTSGGFGEPYSISGQWFHPLYLSGTDGTPEDGVLTGGDGRQYHIASVLGNATLEGDWTEPADPSSAWDSQPNAVVVGSRHNTADWQVDEAEIELPGGQKGKYVDVNFVLAAMNMADRARNMRIVALYGSTGADEEVLYSFSTAEGGSGPKMPEQDGGTDFAVVTSFTKVYNNVLNVTGGIADYSGSLYEFDEPLELNSTKDLWGFRIEDVNPSLNWNARGIVILAATASAGAAGPPPNQPPVADAGTDQYPEDLDGNGSETVTLDGSGSSDSDGTIASWVWKEGVNTLATGQTAQVSLATGVHNITLTVTDDDDATAADTVLVQVIEVDEFVDAYKLGGSYDDAAATSSDPGYSNTTMYWPYTTDARRALARWRVYVPDGATIREAYVKVRSDGGAGDANTSTIRLQLLDYDDSPDFYQNAYSLPVTTNYVDWQLPGTWTADQWYTSSDVSSIVQEFIDRQGYVFGNYLGLRGQNASGLWKRAYTYDYDDHTSGPQLEVHYAGGEAVVELLMADPEARIAQKVHCWIFNPRSVDTLRAKLDGQVIFIKVGDVELEEVFTADYSELEAGQHTLLVELLKPSGEVRASASRTWTTLHDGVPDVGIDVNNAICVNGVPFFPVTPWILNKTSFSAWDDYINCAFGVGYYAQQNITNWKDYLDAADTAGLYVVGPDRWDGYDSEDPADSDTDMLEAYVDQTKAYSDALLAWSWIDEPDLHTDMAPVVRNWMDLTHENDTNHPLWLNLVGYNFTHDGSEWHQNRAKEYCYLYNGDLFDGDRTMVADVLGFDYYCYEYALKWNWCTLEDCMLALDRLRDWNYGLLPTATFIETCDIHTDTGDPDWTPSITAAELKNLVWASIIHGVKAVNWFHYFGTTPQANYDAMAEAKTWIEDLTPVILGPEEVDAEVSDVEQGSGRIDIMVREYDGALYIFAANLKESSETCRFNVTGLQQSTSVTVYEESRSVTSSAGYFEDSFAALGVHIYVIDPAP